MKRKSANKHVDKRERATVRERAHTFIANAQFSSGVGVIAAVVLFVCLNVLAARFFHRWDATAVQLYTLSQPTRALLSRLQRPLDVLVFLSQSDPLSHTVSRVLDEYRAHSPYVQPRFVDPDRNPAEFLALQQRYGLLEGRTEDGRLATDASIVLAQGSQHWFVTTSDIVAYDEQTDQARSRLEQVLTEGIARVIGQKRQTACFARGHQELSATSGGAQGLADFRRQMERNNFETREVDLGVAQPRFELRGCDVTLLIGAQQVYSDPAARELARFVEDGGGLLVALGPITDEDGRILEPGLTPLFEPLGIRTKNSVVFEGEPTLSMPIGIGGEVFLASPRAHAVTSGMLRGNDVQFRVLLQLAQAFETVPSSVASVLLESSETAYAVKSFRALAEGREPPERDKLEAQVVALAAEHPRVAPPTANAESVNRQRGRIIVVGSPSVVWSSTWREPALLGTRRFVENALSWVSAEQPLVSVPDKAAQPAGLALTAAGMSEVRRYVLVYLPLSAALIGVLLMWQRRREATRGKAE